MADKKILMNFDPNGNCKIEAQGYEGGTCIDATAPFEEIFGKVAKPREATGECVARPDQGERVQY